MNSLWKIVRGASAPTHEVAQLVGPYLVRARTIGKEIFVPPVILALLGDPVSHSASPAMQNAALHFHNISGCYTTWKTNRDALSARIQEVLQQRLLGVNLTRPLKDLALLYADHCEESALQAKAANTLYRRGDRLYAANTDGEGFVRSLPSEFRSLHGARIAFLGTGGVWRTVGSALTQRGAEIILFGRDHQRLAEAAEAVVPQETALLSRENVRQHIKTIDILIQGTPATQVGEAAESLVDLLPIENLPKHALVCDLVYRPRETLLLQRAKQRGLATLDGSEMLLHQGAIAFEKFTERDAPLDIMRQALQQELAKPT